MSQRDAIVFVAELMSVLTLVAVSLVLWIQRGQFALLERREWHRALRNGVLGWAAGVLLLFGLGLVLPGRPLLDAQHEASDLTVVVAIFAGIGVMLLASMSLNITLYRAAGKLTIRQMRWTFAAVLALYLLVVAGFSAAVLA